MFLHATSDHLLADILAPVRDTPVALTVCDATDLGLPILSVNDAFTELTGYSASKAAGCDWSFLQGPSSDRKIFAHLRRAARDGVQASGLLVHYRRDGSHFLDEVVISPAHDQTGALRFLMVVHRELKPEAAAAMKPRVQFALRPGLGLVSVAVPDGMPPGWMDRIARGDMARLAHAGRCYMDQQLSLEKLLSAFSETPLA